MRRIPAGLVIAVAVVLAEFSGMAIATQNKDTVQVPGVSYPEEPEVKLNLIVANASMIAA